MQLQHWNTWHGTKSKRLSIPSIVLKVLACVFSADAIYEEAKILWINQLSGVQAEVVRLFSSLHPWQKCKNLAWPRAASESWCNRNMEGQNFGCKFRVYNQQSGDEGICHIHSHTRLWQECIGVHEHKHFGGELEHLKQVLLIDL